MGVERPNGKSSDEGRKWLVESTRHSSGGGRRFEEGHDMRRYGAGVQRVMDGRCEAPRRRRSLASVELRPLCRSRPGKLGILLVHLRDPIVEGVVGVRALQEQLDAQAHLAHCAERHE